MKSLVADIETDGLLDSLTRMWCLGIGDPETGEIIVYADQPGHPPIRDGLARLRAADEVSFHNGLGFDFWAIERLYPGTLRWDQVYDTLVVSRLHDPRKGVGHALDDWGVRLGHPKVKHDEWDRWSPEMAHRNREDVAISLKVTATLKKATAGWGESVALEHRVRLAIALQEHNGFTLDVKLAQALEGELRDEQAVIERELQEEFGPVWVARRGQTSIVYPWLGSTKPAVVVPKVGKVTGKAKTVKDCPYTRVTVQTFNPGSRQQVAARLQKAGWKPTKMTDAGSVAVDDQVLQDLAVLMPEATKLARYFRLGKQLGQVADGDNAWLKLVTKAGRVHGAVNTNGTITGRMSHFKPNMGQVDKKDLRMRAVWIPGYGWVLVGCDAEGLELRMLGHYLSAFDGGDYIEAVTKGTKEEGTDTHSRARDLLRFWIRDQVKREVYAYFYGAGAPKLGLIAIEDATLAGKLNPTDSPWLYKRGTKQLLAPGAIGARNRKLMEEGITGLGKLVKLCQSKHASQGFLRGLDGRRVRTRSAHSALNTLLQSAGGIVMKKALELFHFEMMPELGLVSSSRLETLGFAYCANVHDEVQIEVDPSRLDPKLVGETFAKCIAEAGVRLGVRCPLSGAFDIGANWKETH